MTKDHDQDLTKFVSYEHYSKWYLKKYPHQNHHWAKLNYMDYQNRRIDFVISLVKRLIDDIETPERLGLGEVNKNWKALNTLKKYIKKLERIK